MRALDRIDEIVAPGVTLVGRDEGYEPPELAAGAAPQLT